MPARATVSSQIPPSEIRPRERLLEEGEAALSPQELLALLIGTGTSDSSATDLAEAVITAAGGLREMSSQSAVELLVTPGIGPARAARIRAAFELARRVAACEMPRGVPIRNAGDIVRRLAPRIRGLKKEVFVALLLDGKHRVIGEERISIGSLTTSIVHPREVFAPAIRASAGAIAVAHNHPSGDPTPSREDLEVTERLADVGALVGIQLLDHVVVGDPGYVSLRERGYLPGV